MPADPHATRTAAEIAREIAGPCAADAYGYNCEHARARSTYAWHGEPLHTCHPCLQMRAIAEALTEARAAGALAQQEQIAGYFEARCRFTLAIDAPPCGSCQTCCDAKFIRSAPLAPVPPPPLEGR